LRLASGRSVRYQADIKQNPPTLGDARLLLFRK